MLAQSIGEIKIDARIKGISEIKDITGKPDTKKTIFSTVSLIAWLPTLGSLLNFIIWSIPHFRASLGVDDYSFTWGFFYGFVSLIILGYVWNKVQEVRGLIRSRYRPK